MRPEYVVTLCILLADFILVEASLPTVPGSSGVYLNVEYEVITETHGQNLDIGNVVLVLDDAFTTKRFVELHFAEEVNNPLKSTAFTFMEMGINGTLYPGMAWSDRENGSYSFIGSQILREHEYIFTHTIGAAYETRFNPLTCSKIPLSEQSLLEMHAGECDGDYYRIYLDQQSADDYPLYHIYFLNKDLETHEQVRNEAYGLTLKKRETLDSEDWYLAEQLIPILTKNRDELTNFRFIPAISRTSVQLNKFDFETSPEDISKEANSVKLANDAIVINRAQATVEHELKKTIEVSSTQSFTWFWEVTRSATAGFGFIGGADIPFFGKSETKIEFEVTSDFTVGGSTETKDTTTKTFEVSQKIIVEPQKSIRCSSWLKVIEDLQMPYIAEASVQMFWNVFNPLENKMVEVPVPSNVIVQTIPRIVIGWDVLRTTDDVVIVGMSGSMKAEYGVNAYFVSEDITGNEEEYSPKKNETEESSSSVNIKSLKEYNNQTFYSRVPEPIVYK